MEKVPNEIDQNEVAKNPLEKLTNKEKFDVLLGLFGTDLTRERFISICREYHKARTEQVIQSGDSENYRPHRKVVYSPPKRAHLHNTIMEIISKLAVDTKNPTELQSAVLKDFYSREMLHKL